MSIAIDSLNKKLFGEILSDSTCNLVELVLENPQTELYISVLNTKVTRRLINSRGVGDKRYYEILLSVGDILKVVEPGTMLPGISIQGKTKMAQTEYYYEFSGRDNTLKEVYLSDPLSLVFSKLRFDQTITSHVLTNFQIDLFKTPLLLVKHEKPLFVQDITGEDNKIKAVLQNPDYIQYVVHIHNEHEVEASFLATKDNHILQDILNGKAKNMKGFVVFQNVGLKGQPNSYKFVSIGDVDFNAVIENFQSDQLKIHPYGDKSFMISSNIEHMVKLINS